MRGRRVWWAVSGALLLVWLGATTVDGIAQRLGSLSDGAVAPVPPIETATPGPDQRPVSRYGPRWIPPEPEGPPSSAALAPPPLPVPAALPAPPAPRAVPAVPPVPAPPPPTREPVVPRPQVGPGPRGVPATAPPTPPGGPAPFSPVPPVDVPVPRPAVPTQPPTREIAPAAAPAAGAAAAAPPVPGTPTGPTDAAPAPVPVPSPPPAGPSAGVPSCGWYLAGTWVADGEYTGGRLVGQPYSATLSFRQFGSHLVGAQADDTITYYGRCSVDSLELEVWTGWEYIGRQTGSVAADGLSIAATWSLWSPEAMEGHETLNGRARRAR